MPPKAKGKKSKKKGKSSKPKEARSKAKDEEVLTFNEAVLFYQLQAKQNQHKEVAGDVEDLRRRIKRQKDRNKSLKNEKEKYLQDAIRKAKEHENELKRKPDVTFEEVEKALQEKVAAAREEEDQVRDMKKQIAKMIDEIKSVKLEVERFEEFRNRSRFDNETHIKLLKKEMADMDESYKELSEFFKKNLRSIKVQIERSTSENIDNEKRLASEQALGSLDNSSHQEFSDNKWLLQEVQIHKEHLAKLSSTVEFLEKQNVEMMGDLLTNQFEDVRISKEFFSACDGSDDEDVGETGDEDGEDLSADEAIATHSDKNMEDDDMNWLDNYFDSFGDDEMENARLAPYDLKMLCIVGKKKTLHGELSAKERERMQDLEEDATERHLVWLSNSLSNHQS